MLLWANYFPVFIVVYFQQQKIMERKLRPSAPDTRSIDIEDDYALEYWTRELNVSQTRLKAAVSSAGSFLPDVKKELKNKAQAVSQQDNA